MFMRLAVFLAILAACVAGLQAQTSETESLCETSETVSVNMELEEPPFKETSESTNSQPIPTSSESATAQPMYTLESLMPMKKDADSGVRKGLVVGKDLTRSEAQAMKENLHADGFLQANISREGPGFSVKLPKMTREELLKTAERLRGQGYTVPVAPTLPDRAHGKSLSGQTGVRIGKNLTRSEANALKQQLAQDGFEGASIIPEGVNFAVTLPEMDKTELLEAAEVLRASGYTVGTSPLLPDRERKSAPSNLNSYSVVLGTFDTADAANEMREELLADGYSPVVNRKKDGKTQVLVGAFPQRSDAENLMKDLAQAGYSAQDVVLSMPRGSAASRRSSTVDIKQEIADLQSRIEKLNSKLENVLREKSSQGDTELQVGKKPSAVLEIRVASGLDENEKRELFEQLKDDGFKNIILDHVPDGTVNVSLFVEGTRRDAEKEVARLRRLGYQFGSVKVGKIIRSNRRIEPEM